MSRYLVLWRRSPTAWPTDPVEYSNLVQKFGVSVAKWMKKGKMKEHAHFLDGTSGYTIWEVEPKELLRNSSMLAPYYEFEAHEFIPFAESGKILGEVFKAQTKRVKK